MKKKKEIFFLKTPGVSYRHLGGTATSHFYKALKCQWYLAILMSSFYQGKRLYIYYCISGKVTSCFYS